MSFNAQKPDYDKIALMESELDLVSTDTEQNTYWNHYYLMNNHDGYANELRRRKRRMARNFGFACLCVALFLFGAGLMLFRTEVLTETPRPLPAGVLVGPNASFVVARGQEGLGLVLCDDSRFQTTSIGKRVVINCVEGSPKFYYDKNRIWRP